ncbi:glycosyltransferase [Pseudomonas atacamensis]|uniref:glycosyltransferase n=1 Tax=Pseudomonas TaxID=286 RepID=UPI001032A06A|nr:MULTISPECIES: glycosyltransferase [Pseudomonas]UVK92198.1 glycosyltransferase [Pseudomonas atacamensis]
MNTKKIIIVLGMHRSGTSALTRGLSALGVSLGDELHPAGPDNPTGFWEDSDVIAINNEILCLLGSAHDHVGVIDANVFDLPEFPRLYETAKELVRKKTASTSIWGMKDPRITRLLPFWKKLLDELGFEVGYVIALRNPLNVAASLTARNQTAPVKSYVLWLEHMLQAVANTHSDKRLVVSYDNLLSAPNEQLLRISATLELDAPSQEQLEIYAEQFLDKGLRHGQHNDDELFKNDINPQFLAPTYKLLLECALDELNINSQEFDERLEPLLSALRRLLPMLQLLSQAESATVAANEGIITRDRQIEALNKHINHLNEEHQAEQSQQPLYIRLKLSEEEQRARFTTLQLEQTSRYIELAAARVRQAAENAAYEKFVAQQAAQNSALEKSLAEQTARNTVLKSTIAEHQSALERADAHIQSLDQQIRQLSSALASTQGSLVTAGEKIDALTNSWATYFLSKSWRSLRLIPGFKNKPAIILSNGREFDDQFYMSSYPDVVAAGMTAREHYLGAGLREGRQPLAEQAPPVPAVVPVHSPQVDVAELPEEPATEAVTPDDTRSATACEVAASIVEVEFDEAFYLTMYPDIANCGMDPRQHFFMHGQHEGRIGTVPKVTLNCSLEELQRNGKQTALLVSHEASRTGAPILSLNIAQQLTEHFNVVALLLGPGSLFDAFVDIGAVVAGPLDRNNPIGASLAIAEFLDTYKIDFAIVNSLESNLALKPLADRYIPAVSLIHEFAVYTRPRSAIQNALLWASQTVFSSDVTLDSAVQVLPQLNDCSIPVLAQGKSTVPGEAQDEAQANAEKMRLQHEMRPKDQDADTIIILGAGRVQLRKGVDIFIECATRVINSPIGHKCRFIWIGDNYDPETDIAYSVYLYDQIKRSGIAEQFTIISETAQIEEVYAMSDMLLLSSRLDPLPNVAIDAMVRGLPVLCFDRTTGIADVLERNGLAPDCIAPYLDTGNMAEKIIRLASSHSTRLSVGEQVKAVAAREFNMASYVEKLVNIATDLNIAGQFEKNDCATIAEAGVLDVDFYTPANITLEDEASAIRRYVRSWSRGVLRRKPFPGFDPAFYKELNSQAVGQHDPLAHYIRMGRPLGPWLSDRLDWKKTHTPTDAIKALLFVSVSEPAQLLTALDQITVCGINVSVIVQARNEASRLAFRDIASNHSEQPLDIKVCDRGPLSSLLGHLASIDYQTFDLIGHLNLQAEPIDAEFTTQSAYHRFLIENMIDGEHLALRTIACQLTEQDTVSALGLVFPEDPNIGYLSQDFEQLDHLCKAADFAPAQHKHLAYPVNGVFWSVPAAISPLVNSLPQLKVAVKKMHLPDAVEDRILAQMLPLACTSRKMRINTTVVTGVTY